MASKSEHEAFLEQVKSMRDPKVTKDINGQISRSQSRSKAPKATYDRTGPFGGTTHTEGRTAGKESKKHKW